MATQSTALTKRKLDTELMPPPPPTKRIKRPTTVLDEDTYSDALSHIIARDFFPGLLELESQEEYLDALKSKDDDWIETAGRKLTAAMTPRPGRRRGTGFPSPAGILQTPGRTPETVVSDLEQEDMRSKVDMNLSLNGFLSKYTSEDAESFNKVLDKQNQKKAEKHAWLYNGNKFPGPAQIAYRKQQQKLLQASAAQEATDGQLVKRIVQEDDRPAGPITWNHAPKNNFMYRPESLEDTIQTTAQKSEELSRAAPKKVVYGNTRLPMQFSGAPEDSVPPSPTLSAIKDAIAGRPRIPASEGGYDGSETPRVNGYAFVDSEEPEPEPVSRHKSDWSKISFGSVDETRNPFSMQESSNREQLHHKMVDQAARTKRHMATSKNMKTPVSGSLRNVASTPALTPAGHRLLGKLGGNTPLRKTASSIWSNNASQTPRGAAVKGLVTPRP